MPHFPIPDSIPAQIAQAIANADMTKSACFCITPDNASQEFSGIYFAVQNPVSTAIPKRDAPILPIFVSLGLSSKEEQGTVYVDIFGVEERRSFLSVIAGVVPHEQLKYDGQGFCEILFTKDQLEVALHTYFQPLTEFENGHFTPQEVVDFLVNYGVSVHEPDEISMFTHIRISKNFAIPGDKFQQILAFLYSQGPGTQTVH